MPAPAEWSESFTLDQETADWSGFRQPGIIATMPLRQALVLLSSDLPRYRRLAKEGGWIIVGQIASVLGSLALVRVLTGRLDTTQYGELALGLTLAGLMNQVVMGGLSAGVGRFYSIAAEKQDLRGYLHATRKLLVYATAAAAAIGLAVMAGLLSLGYGQWLGLAAATLIFSVLSGYNASLSGIQAAARQRGIVAFHAGLDAWLKILLALGLLIWLGRSSTAVVIGFALSSLFVNSSQLLFLRRLGQTETASRGHPWMGQMWAYSWPMAAGGLFNWGYYASQRWALELYVSTSEVGQFYALTQIAYTPLSMGGAMLMSFLTPILFARVGDATDDDRLRSAHRVVMRVGAVGLGLTLIIALASCFAHDLVFRLLVAREYRGISVYMPRVLLAAGILQVSIAMASIVSIENQTRRILPIAILGNSGVAWMNFYFTRRWGISGLTTSMMAGAAIHLAWMIVIVSRSVIRLRRS